MPRSYSDHLPPLPVDRLRLVSGGSVLVLHVLVALALLLHLQAKKEQMPAARPMQLLHLRPETPPAPAPRPVAPMRSLSPPAAALSLPPFVVAPSEVRRNPAFQPVTPPISGLGQPAPAAPGNPGDLFSDQKKEEFKRFFKQQAAEDRRENAKPAGGKSTCNVFRKPGEETMPDLQASNGITRNFVPAFGVGIDTPSDGNVPASLQACN